MLSSIQGIILAILALGFLIFIHELGHFLAAKRSGIRVEKFSIGFGPTLVGFTRGETEYCISIVPFGGYVKMAGENPEERPEGEHYIVTEDNPTGEFPTAPVRHRIFVAVAGPAMNILLGTVLFSLVYIIGLNANSVQIVEMLTDEPIGTSEQLTQIGLVAEDGPAEVGGIEPGDTIISINGRQIRSWQDFNMRILADGREKELEIVVSRDGQQKTLYVTPASHHRKGLGQVGQIKVSALHKIMVGVVEEGSSAANAGIRYGDLIKKINGKDIYHVPDFSSLIWQIPEWLGKAHQEFYRQIRESPEVTLEVMRGEESLAFNLPVNWTNSVIVEEESEAEQAGIQTGDQIVGINGESIENFELHPRLYELAQTQPNQAIEINLRRNGEQLSAMLTPQIIDDENQLDLRGLHWKMLLSGLEFTVPPIIIPTYNLIEAMGKGITTNWLIFKNIARTLQRLVTREVPAKFLSGPVGIVDMTRQVVQIGLTSFLFFVGFISVNLAIINLLPIPIADGGLILFFVLEKLRGRPLSLRRQIIIQQVSIVLIIGLFLYITWNDIVRVNPF